MEEIIRLERFPILLHIFGGTAWHTVPTSARTAEKRASVISMCSKKSIFISDKPKLLMVRTYPIALLSQEEPTDNTRSQVRKNESPSPERYHSGII